MANGEISIASKRIRYLRINLMKEVKDLYLEKCKTWMKEIEEDKQMKRHTMFMGFCRSLMITFLCKKKNHFHDHRNIKTPVYSVCLSESPGA